MKRAKPTAIAVCVTAGVVGLGLATGTAHAGTSGQHLRICLSPSVMDRDYKEIKVNGFDQNGSVQEVTWPVTPGQGCTDLSDHWWQGQTSIALTQSSAGANDGNGGADIPKDQGDSDWFTVNFGKF